MVYGKHKTTITERKKKIKTEKVPKGKKEHTKSRTEIAGTAVCCRQQRREKRKTKCEKKVKFRPAFRR